MNAHTYPRTYTDTQKKRKQKSRNGPGISNGDVAERTLSKKCRHTLIGWTKAVSAAPHWRHRISILRSNCCWAGMATNMAGMATIYMYV